MSSGEFKCVFCKESFSDKESLQVHFRKHGDKKFHLNKSRHQDEPALPDKSTSNRDQADLVECDVCPEVFTSISKAITHKHKVHPDHDAKYFCPWCGKLFTMKHLYNKHIDSTHTDNEMIEKKFSCDLCAVEFHLPAAMSYHNKFFHRMHEMPSIGNSKKLKLYNSESVCIYYCPFCGEEYDNKINLHKHMSDDHHDENQHPVDVLRCPVCEAIFYHLDAYEVHLTYHSVDDMYSDPSAMMDEITDFSLETVPPLAEKVESIEPNEVEQAMGMEQLFELTMDDAKLKKKKHKKHKKSKKSAITLDQFLNMNTDVFGEGLDFQGIEEVPTRTITKSLKTYNKKQTLQKLPADIEKLKRQGIVVKKNTKTIPVKRLAGKPSQIGAKIIPNLATQSKPNTMSSEVLTKLINQNNSQIKIVKKSSLESKCTDEPMGDTKQNSLGIEQNEAVEKSTLNEFKASSSICQGNDVTEDNTTHDPDPVLVENDNTNKSVDKTSSSLDNYEEDSNHSQSILDEVNKTEETQTKRQTEDQLTNLRNNSNIVVKSNKPILEVNTNNEETTHDSDENVSNHDETDCEDTETNVNGKTNRVESFNVLKHLSHLTVKPCGQDIKHVKLENPQGVMKKVEPSEVSKIAHLIRNNPAKLASNTVKTSNPPVPLTNMSPKMKSDDLEPNNYHSDHENNEEPDKTIAEPAHLGKITSILNNPHINIQAIKKTHQPVLQKPSPTENLTKTENLSTDLLKNLKNVTAKPVGVDKTSNISISSPKGSPKLMTVIKKEPSPPVKLTKVIHKDIEIYKIDDSDSDEANSNNVQTNVNKETHSTNNSTNILKNINKNITVKSVNKPQNKVTNKTQIEEFHNDDDVDRSEIQDTPLHSTRNPNYSNMANNQKKSALNNVLKNLSKNITVKSGNSPSHFAVSEEQKSQDSNFAQNDTDSDTDSLSGRVKITELKDNHSYEEFHKDNASSDVQSNVKVQYPDDSDNEERIDNDEFGDNFSDEDIETHIPASTVKNIPVSKPNIDSLKNVCKDLVIKPSGQASNTTPQYASDEIPPFAKSLSSKISTTSAKQDTKQVKINNTNTRNAKQFVGQSVMNKSAVNRMATSSHHVDSVNKEVKTVKTFQSQSQTQTVIEEITTTVTKTIKTVNQSMNQEIRNSGQSITAPQKIQHLNAMNRNIQGLKVRQSAPMPAGPRVRNPGLRPTRPVLPSPVRASNQLVAVRPRFNPPRATNPRLPMTRPSTSTNQPRQQIGKIGPACSKRPNIEELGHFSCFKKTKESLIPETDFTAINKNDGESSVQFSKTMQMSKSNFASTTKTVKGNSAVITTQMKSEMTASSQQLGKLRNLSGLSVVKTSQTNQSHVEEKSERNAANQNTLDAIQRLQSQGLLVKKPRIVSEDEHSYPGSDDMNHFSDEEFGT